LVSPCDWLLCTFRLAVIILSGSCVWLALYTAGVSDQHRQHETAFQSLLISSHTLLELSTLKPKCRLTPRKRRGWLNRKRAASFLPAAVLKSLLERTFEVAGTLQAYTRTRVSSPLGKTKLHRVPSHELTPLQQSPSWQSDGRLASQEILRLCGLRRLHFTVSVHTMSSPFLVHLNI
jgi:hypothetical protein